MVLIEEMECNFWGLVLENGKRYTQTVERAFHISMAALEPTTLTDEIKKNKYVSLMLQHNKSEYILCTLEHGQTLNVTLDLNFLDGEEVTFFLNGKGSVHLSGYLTPEMLDEEEEDEAADSDDSSDLSYEAGVDEEVGSEDDSDEEEDDENVPQLMSFDEIDESGSEEEEEIEVKGKRKKNQGSSQKKKKKMVEEEEEEDDEDEINLEDIMADEEEEDEEDLGASFLDVSAKSKKGKKKNKNVSKESPSPKKEMKEEEKKPVENGGTPETEKKKKKKRKKNKKNQQNQENGQGDAPDASNTPNAKTDSKSPGSAKQSPGSAKQSPGSAKKPKKMVLQGGVIAEDLKDGHGPVATPGKNVGVYYKGTLTNGKSFDETTSGKPFSFKLGKQEVIKGWDIGVKGMRVGGKRKLTIPSKMAYGQQKMGDIPANSTLCFEVELKVLR